MLSICKHDKRYAYRFKPGDLIYSAHYLILDDMHNNPIKLKYNSLMFIIDEAEFDYVCFCLNKLTFIKIPYSFGRYFKIIHRLCHSLK